MRLKGFLKLAATIVWGGSLILSLGGCGEYIAFGTATKFGLDISQKADQTVDVTLGYQRIEIVSIPVPDDEDNKDLDATQTKDTYSVLGRFHVQYDTPWGKEPLRLNQLFATGFAAQLAASNPQMMEFFGQHAHAITEKVKP